MPSVAYDHCPACASQLFHMYDGGDPKRPVMACLCGYVRDAAPAHKPAVPAPVTRTARLGPREGNWTPAPAHAPIRLVLPLPPTTNNLYASIIRDGKIVRVETKECREFKKRARAIAAGSPCLTGDVYVTLHVYLPRKGADVANREKATLDSLKGLVMEDDSQVAELHIYRHWDKDCPRVEVTVGEI